MQLKHALLPVAVLAASGIFLAKRQFAAAEKRQNMAIYRETIRMVTEHRAETKTAAEAKARQEAEKKAAPEVVTRASIDLMAMAKSISSMDKGGMPDMQAMIKIQKTIMGLSAEDLSGLIADAGALDLADEQKSGLVLMLLQGLTQKDPKSAVLAGQALSQGKSGSQKMMISMGGVQPAFSAWAKKDPAAALQWYDSEVAAGHFENKSLENVNQTQTQFESGILPGLAARDPAAAKARLLAMNEEQRMAVLSASSGFSEDAASKKTFASLVRTTLSPEKQVDAISSMASTILGASDFKGAGEFLATAAVSPEEKGKILPQLAGGALRGMVYGSGAPLTAESAAPLRQWLEEQQPGSGTGKVMGESLASVTGSGNFDQGKALALVSSLYDQSPSDDLITSFVSRSRPQENPDLYRGLVEKIKDPALRRSTLESLNNRK